MVEIGAGTDLADGAKVTIQAFCPAGKVAVAGGGRGDAENSEETSVTSSRPAKTLADTEPPTTGGSFTGWRLTTTNLTGGMTAGIRPTVWVVCVPGA